MKTILSAPLSAFLVSLLFIFKQAFATTPLKSESWIKTILISTNQPNSTEVFLLSLLFISNDLKTNQDEINFYSFDTII